MVPAEPMVDVNMEESKEEVRTGNIHTSGLEPQMKRTKSSPWELNRWEYVCVFFNVFALNGLS